MPKPAPRMSERDMPFWDGVRAGKLRVQECADCGRQWFPSQDRCPSCRSRAIGWVDTATTGTVYTFTVIHGPGFEGRPGGFEQDYPYAVGVIELDGTDGIRMPGAITGVPTDAVCVGMRVEAVFDAAETRLPEFRAASIEGSLLLDHPQDAAR